MLTDKQSLIFCAIVAIGFSASGIIGILDNHAVIGLLIICFLVVIVNMLLTNQDQDSEDKKLNKPNEDE